MGDGQAERSPLTTLGLIYTPLSSVKYLIAASWPEKTDAMESFAYVVSGSPSHSYYCERRQSYRSVIQNAVCNCDGQTATKIGKTTFSIAAQRYLGSSAGHQARGVCVCLSRKRTKTNGWGNSMYQRQCGQKKPRAVHTATQQPW